MVMSASSATSVPPAVAEPPFKGPLKIAIHLSDQSLGPVEQARKLLTEELGLGEAPPLEMMIELALLRIDPDELATSCMTTLLGRRAPNAAELDFGEPPLDAELPPTGTVTS